MNEEIKIKEFDPILIASFSYIGKYTDCGKYYSKIYKEAKFKAKGTPFLLCHDAEYKENANIEVCVPITGRFDAKEVTIKELPKIKGVSLIHSGSYDLLKSSYSALCEYIQNNNLESYSPSREIYVKGPGMIFKGNPKNYITELIIPIK